jgi:hypothetical protein
MTGVERTSLIVIYLGKKGNNKAEERIYRHVQIIFPRELVKQYSIIYYCFNDYIGLQVNCSQLFYCVMNAMNK